MSMWVVHVMQVLCLAQLRVGMSVVRGLRLFGDVCEMCMGLARAESGYENWVRTNPVGTGGSVSVLRRCRW